MELRKVSDPKTGKTYNMTDPAHPIEVNPKTGLPITYLSVQQVDDIAEMIWDWWNEGEGLRFENSTCFQYKSGFPYELTNRIKEYLASDKVTK